MMGKRKRGKKVGVSGNVESQPAECTGLQMWMIVDDFWK